MLVASITKERACRLPNLNQDDRVSAVVKAYRTATVNALIGDASTAKKDLAEYLTLDPHGSHAAEMKEVLSGVHAGIALPAGPPITHTPIPRYGIVCGTETLHLWCHRPVSQTSEQHVEGGQSGPCCDFGDLEFVWRIKRRGFEKDGHALAGSGVSLLLRFLRSNPNRTPMMTLDIASAAPDLSFAC